MNAVNEEAKNDVLLISNSKPWFQVRHHHAFHITINYLIVVTDWLLVY